MNILKLTLITLAVATLLLFTGCSDVAVTIADISGNWYVTINYDSTTNAFSEIYLWTITQNNESGTISWYHDGDLTDTVIGNDCLAWQLPFAIDEHNYMTVTSDAQVLACAGNGTVSATFQGTGHNSNINLSGTFVDAAGVSYTVQLSCTRN